MVTSEKLPPWWLCSIVNERHLLAKRHHHHLDLKEAVFDSVYIGVFIIYTMLHQTPLTNSTPDPTQHRSELSLNECWTIILAPPPPPFPFLLTPTPFSIGKLLECSADC